MPPPVPPPPPARQGRKPLPEDRPCSGCGRSAPAVAFGMRRTGAGNWRRKSRCSECESAGAVESRRRRRKREREASES